MRSRSLVQIVAGATVAVLVVLRVGAQGVDPIVGTWELNVAKSKYVPGPAPKSETRTWAVAGAEFKATSKSLDSAGRPTAAEWTVAFDGKDRPLAGNADAETQAITRIDTLTVEFTQKRGGKVVITGRRTISKDGKVMTITTKGTNAKGQAIDVLEVYDRR